MVSLRHKPNEVSILGLIEGSERILQRRNEPPNIDRITLHPGQLDTYQSKARFKVRACGRRWGKTQLSIYELTDTLLTGKPTAWFAPSYKFLTDAWRDIKSSLAGLIVEKSETEYRIKLRTGGTLDMWTLENADAGRGRKYQRVVVDEAGMVPNLEESWTQAIRPTLSDFQGDAIFAGTPKGRNYFWRLWTMGQDPLNPDWQSWQAPTINNPYIAQSEVEAARLDMPERAFLQEYEAAFIEESGGVFRKVMESVDAGRTENEGVKNNRRYYMGVDLARLQDFTVITVLDNSGRQVYHERFNQISWDRQLETIERVAKQYKALVTVDSTGIGDPLAEQMYNRGVSLRPYILTNPSKCRLIDSLAISLEAGKLRLMDIPVQSNELMSYEYEITQAGNVRMNAPGGMHDDCVISLAMAHWNCKPEAVIDVEPVILTPRQQMIRDMLDAEKPKDELHVTTNDNDW